MLRIGIILVLAGVTLFACSAWTSGQPVPTPPEKQHRFERPDRPVRGNVKINGPVEIQPHTLARFKLDGVDAEDKKVAIRWRVHPMDKVDRATTVRGILEFAAPPGEYTIEVLVIAVGADGGITLDDAYHKLRIGDPAPPPPPPPPPIPPDPLTREIQALYQADLSATKKADLGLLVELFRQASVLAKDSSVTTTAALAERVAGAGASLLPRERLQSVRRRIAQFVATEFGDQDATLTTALRDKASATYLRISEILRSIGGA